MATIEELTEERNRLYAEHNEAFQAWMDAEVELEIAIENDIEVKRRSEKTRRYIFFTFTGIVAAFVMANIWV